MCVIAQSREILTIDFIVTSSKREKPGEGPTTSPELQEGGGEIIANPPKMYSLEARLSRSSL